MIDYLADLESDLSRYHRIDDIFGLDGPRFMRLAWRVSVYGGVMSLRVDEQRRQAPARPPRDDRRAASAPAKAKNEVTWVGPATFLMLTEVSH